MFPQGSPSSSLSIAGSVSAIALPSAFLAILEVAHSSQNGHMYFSTNGQKIPHNPTSAKQLIFTSSSHSLHLIYVFTLMINLQSSAVIEIKYLLEVIFF